ncbi:MAG TPA: spondin domain-containing protein [Candidatus Eisenbacteria bacterium]|jgi:hypothetical protein
MLRTWQFGLLILGSAAAAANPLEADSMKMEGTTFTVRIENVSSPSTLHSASGMTAPAPNSPGLWVVHTRPARLFKAGKPDLGWGLEPQAEDGNPATLAEHCMHHQGVVSSGIINTPLGDEQPGPAMPGKAYQFTITAKPGERLSLTTMFGPSNDLFFAPKEAGIALFDKAGEPMSADVTSQLVLWDTGTEVNQEPGFGPDQAPRQSAPNTGASERKPVMPVKDAFSYPPVAQVIKVTITPSAMASQ